MGKPVGSSSSVSMKENLVLIIEEPGKQEILQQFCDFVVNFLKKRHLILSMSINIILNIIIGMSHRIRFPDLWTV